MVDRSMWMKERSEGMVYYFPVNVDVSMNVISTDTDDDDVHSLS